MKFIYNTLVTGQESANCIFLLLDRNEGFVSKERTWFSFHFIFISVLFGCH